MQKNEKRLNDCRLIDEHNLVRATDRPIDRPASQSFDHPPHTHTHTDINTETHPKRNFQNIKFQAQDAEKISEIFFLSLNSGK